MSYLRASITRATFAPSFTPASRSIGALQLRSFQSCRILAAGKESALHQEGRAEHAEAHKQDQLQKQREGKGHWKDELASDSESAVKADRNDIDSSQSIEELQKSTAKKAEQEQKGQ